MVNLVLDPELDRLMGFNSAPPGSIITVGVRFTSKSGLRNAMNGNIQAAVSPNNR